MNLMLFLSVPTSSHTLLIVVKPTTRPEEREEPLSVSSFGSPLKEAEYLFVDANCDYLHDCDTNKKSINNTLEYIKTSQYGAENSVSNKNGF